MNRWSRLAVVAGIVAGLAPSVLAQGEGEGGAEGAAAVEATAEETPTVEEAPPPDYSQRLGTMEEKVNAEKERVFRSKATLQLLREIVIQGANSGSRSQVFFNNTLSNSYKVESVAYYLDGQSIYAKFDPSGGFSRDEEIMVWEGAIPPGKHQLTVNLVLRGSGKLFKYVEGYSFKVQSTQHFTVEEGQATDLHVDLFEQGGIGTPFLEKPKVEFEVKAAEIASGDE